MNSLKTSNDLDIKKCGSVFSCL